MSQCLAKSSIEEAFHHRKGLHGAKVTSFCKKLPQNVSNIESTLLSKRAIEEHVLNWFYRVHVAVRATLINLCWVFPKPFIHCHRLVENWPIFLSSRSLLGLASMDQKLSLLHSGWMFLSTLSPLSLCSCKQMTSLIGGMYLCSL